MASLQSAPSPSPEGGLPDHDIRVGVILVVGVVGVGVVGGLSTLAFTKNRFVWKLMTGRGGGGDLKRPQSKYNNVFFGVNSSAFF